MLNLVTYSAEWQFWKKGIDSEGEARRENEAWYLVRWIARIYILPRNMGLQSERETKYC